MHEDITEQAARWHVLSQSDAMDWDGFTEWLEADPRHREAYDAVTLLDEDVTTQRAAIAEQLPLEQDLEPAPRAPRRWVYPALGGGAVAAALALAMLFPGTSPDSDTMRYATATGETRQIALADGTAITLAPESTLELVGGRSDRLRLEGGGYFVVPHRPERTLTIAAGPLKITDIGTSFSISVAPQAVRVEVAEGALRVGGAQMPRPVDLQAGSALVADTAAHAVSRSRIAPGDVASWRSGQLRYDDAPLALVVADLNRYATRPITLAPEAASRRFTGVLTIGDEAELVTNLARIASLRVEQTADGTRLHPDGDD